MREVTDRKSPRLEDLRPPRAQFELRFDGLYVSNPTDGIDDNGVQRNPDRLYVRFYPEGVVIDALVECDGPIRPDKMVASWLNIDNEVANFGLGTWQSDGQSVEYSTYSAKNTIHFHGPLLDDAMVINSQSEQDGIKAAYKLSFLSFNKIEGYSDPTK